MGTVTQQIIFERDDPELGLKLRNFCLCSLGDMGLSREKMAADKFYVIHM